MTQDVSRDFALEILAKYNKEKFHIQHAVTVGMCMKWFAEQLGYKDEADHWEVLEYYMILILNCILNSTAKKRRSF